MTETSNTTKKTSDYLRVLWKRKWLSLLLIVLSAGVAYGLYTRQEPKYRTTMTVKLGGGRSMAGQDSAAAEFLQGFFQGTDAFNTQLTFLKDRGVLRLMVRNKILGAKPVPEHFRGRTEEDILAELEESIEVKEKGRRTSLVEIEVRGTNPELLPIIAGLLWQQFTDMQTLLQNELVSKSKLAVSKEFQKASEEFEAAEKELRNHLRQNQLSQTSFLNHQEQLPERQKALQERWETIQQKLTLEKADYESVRAAQETGPDALMELYHLDVVASNATVRAQQEFVERLEGQVVELRKAGIGQNDFRHKQLLERIRQEKSNLDGLRRSRLRSFVNEYEANEKLLSRLDTTRKALAEEIATFEGIQQKYEELNSQSELKKERYDKLAAAYDEIVREAGRSMSGSSVAISPTVPRTPYSPNLLLNILMGVLVGLFLGMGVAFGFEALDDSIRAEDEIEQSLKLPCLGVIHKPDSTRGGTPAVDLASVIDPRSIFAEEFRSIRTALGFTFDRRRERHYSMAISSFEVQEGKTTVSTNLATVIAASGLRTLLVDGDMRNGRIHRTFGVANEGGLSDVLAGKAELDQAIEETEISNLSVLPSGRLYDNPAEMLESPAMRELLKDLAERFDRVVFDTPPCGAVTDATVLGKQVDATIFVAGVGKARKRLLRRSVKSMLAVGVRIAGVVLNEMKAGRKRYYRKYLHLYRRPA